MGDITCQIFLSGYFNTLLQADFSSVSSPYRAAEEQTYIFFWGFLDECEGNVWQSY